MSTDGYIFQRKDKKWCGKYKDTTGKWKYLYRKTKGEAREALNQAIADRDAGIKVTDVTLNAAVEAWLEDTQDSISLRTWVNRESLYRCHIKPTDIGKKKLKTVTAEDIRSFYKVKAKDLAPSSVKRLHDIINKIMRDAVRLKQLRSNPVVGIPTPKIPRQSIEVLTVRQVRKLLETCKGDRYEGVYVLGACCGMRIGEVLGLTWDCVNLDNGTINVRNTLWKGKLYPPKTPHSRRTIKLPAIALEALQRPESSEGYVFATSKGTPLAVPNFHTHHWRPMLKKARLPESLTYHKLRHGAASLMLNQNVPVPVVSRYLGHSNPSITMKIYAHMIDGMGGLAADGMDEALG